MFGAVHPFRLETYFSTARRVLMHSVAVCAVVGASDGDVLGK